MLRYVIDCHIVSLLSDALLENQIKFVKIKQTSILRFCEGYGRSLHYCEVKITILNKISLKNMFKDYDPLYFRVKSSWFSFLELFDNENGQWHFIYILLLCTVVLYMQIRHFLIQNYNDEIVTHLVFAYCWSYYLFVWDLLSSVPPILLETLSI